MIPSQRNMMGDETTRVGTVATVNVKLLPFWPANLEVWFAQVEAQFTTRGITAQKTLFDYIVPSLSPGFATEVRDPILKPPGERPYDTFKMQLIKRTELPSSVSSNNSSVLKSWGNANPRSYSIELLGDKMGAPDCDGTFLREHCKKRMVVLTWFWPPQMHLSASSTVSIKECAHRRSLL